jgi:putative transposase
MPDHFHVLVTPSGALERVVQLIKGGFSRRATVDLGSKMDVWQKGFSDHRIRDAVDYNKHKAYIAQNPVAKRLCEYPHYYEYSGASGRYFLDPCPQGLRPIGFDA